jgi:hypothetical protein
MSSCWHRDGSGAVVAQILLARVVGGAVLCHRRVGQAGAVDGSNLLRVCVRAIGRATAAAPRAGVAPPREALTDTIDEVLRGQYLSGTQLHASWQQRVLCDRTCTEKSTAPAPWIRQRAPITAVAACAQQLPHHSGRNWLRIRAV